MGRRFIPWYLINWVIAYPRNRKASSSSINFNLRLNMQQLLQITIDTLAWLLMPFAACVSISWVVSLFRYR